MKKNKAMKTFKDLDFEFYPYGVFSSTRAVMHFENEYGISVITGKGAYVNGEKPYEIAVLYNGEITYNTDITDNVIGWQNEDNVTDIMKKIQELAS
jgi:hypothetical protein